MNDEERVKMFNSLLQSTFKETMSSSPKPKCRCNNRVTSHRRRYHRKHHKQDSIGGVAKRYHHRTQHHQFCTSRRRALVRRSLWCGIAWKQRGSGSMNIASGASELHHTINLLAGDTSFPTFVQNIVGSPLFLSFEFRTRVTANLNRLRLSVGWSAGPSVCPWWSSWKYAFLMLKLWLSVCVRIGCERVCL